MSSLKKALVIKDRNVISDVFNQGDKLYGGSFLCFVRKRADRQVCYAVTAGKKTMKSAVRRNRAKRVLRSAFFEYLQEKEISGVDIVLVALQDMSKIKSTEVSNKLKSLL